LIPNVEPCRRCGVKLENKKRGIPISATPLISIVDDDHAVAEALRGLLRSHGYAAACFASAEAYLMSPLRRDTACLILDVHMPGMSGLQLQERLRIEGDRTPVIFISGAADEQTRKGALEAGARGFLSKPINQAVLTRLLGESLTKVA
jgi:FixJ family two-component response regulator